MVHRPAALRREVAHRAPLHGVSSQRGAARRVRAAWRRRASAARAVLGAARCEQADAWFDVWRRFERERLGRATRARWMAPVRADVPALLARGAELGHARSGRCREILRLADALFTFVEVEGVEPANNAARSPSPLDQVPKGCTGTVCQPPAFSSSL